jgi:hypothetical protein
MVSDVVSLACSSMPQEPKLKAEETEAKDREAVEVQGVGRQSKEGYRRRFSDTQVRAMALACRAERRKDMPVVHRD